jgi:fucose 4-O-acetylase-like acetyltransferase
VTKPGEPVIVIPTPAAPSPSYTSLPDSPTPRKQRSMIIDIVRGIAITLVVLGHTNQGIIHRGWWGPSPHNPGTYLDVAIYTFHMPAFFFVSGIFLCAGVEKRGQGHYTRDKLRTMIYPYLLWAVIFYVALDFLQRFVVQYHLSIRQYALATVTGNVSWFLPTIFVTVMLGMLLRRIPMPLLFVIASAAAFFWHPVGATDIDSAISHLPFLVAGMWVGRRFEILERIPRALSAIGAISLASLILVLTIHGVTQSRYLFIPLGLLGTLMLMLIAQLLGRTTLARFFAWAGEASFGIFLLSQFPQGAGREILLRFAHTTAPIPQLLVPTFLAVILTGWIYQYRVRLHIGWMFIWPFGSER